jgi:hypothetical protein
MIVFVYLLIICPILSLSLGENYYNFIETNDDKLVRRLVDKLSEYSQLDKEQAYSATRAKKEELGKALNENLSIQDELFLANLEEDGPQQVSTTPLPDIIEKLLTIPLIKTTQLELRRQVEVVEKDNSKGIIDVVKDLFDFNT